MRYLLISLKIKVIMVMDSNS